MATESRQCHRPYERKRDSGVQGAGGGGGLCHFSCAKSLSSEEEERRTIENKAERKKAVSSFHTPTPQYMIPANSGLALPDNIHWDRFDLSKMTRDGFSRHRPPRASLFSSPRGMRTKGRPTGF